VRAYWWNDIPNFGDALTPYLLQYYANTSAEWSPLVSAHLVGTGSILHHIPADWPGTILGSGLLAARFKVKARDARVLALRGPLTAARVPGDYAIGDPGLLADEMIPLPERKFDLGLVPHWSDRQLQFNRTFLPYKPLIIDTRQEPLEVIKQIGSCRKIVSSSLHGLILADAFDIPRRFETTDLFDLDTLFKFEDYNASIGLPLRVGETQKANRNHVETRKHEIYDAFREL
jgi:pyruvyltransferase